MSRALVTGASGYVGGRLVRELLARGEPVGCVVRNPSRGDFPGEVTVHRADMLDPRSLNAIGDGYTTAYYLVHSMGRGGDSDYEQPSGTPQTRSREIQIGSADVLTYGEMLDRMADALGIRRRPRIPVPLLTPWLSSHWIGLVTPVDAGVARPLIEGLSTNTTVTDPSGMALFDFQPRSFEQALCEAIAEEADRALTPSS